MGLTELLFVAALWGAPWGLLWISWHRYRRIQGASGTNTSLAAASLVLLFLTSGTWLLFYGLILISDHYKAVNSILSIGPKPTTLAVFNILVCAASFIFSLFIPKTVQGTVPFQRAVTFATGSMLLVWMFALTAH